MIQLFTERGLRGEEGRVAIVLQQGEQVAVLPISEKYNDHAKKLSQLLINSDIRGLVDDRDEKIGKKIRDAEVKKVPYMLIIGEKEEAEGTVSIRQHGKGDQGSLSVQELADRINKEINEMLNA